jgi:hypothetical protein
MIALTQDLTVLERRSGLDRRQKGTPIFSKHWLTGRRVSSRREDDKHSPYNTDRHSSKTLAVIVLILALSVLDAMFTLDLVNAGATELNPIMAYYLNHGPLVFFGVKYLLTSAAVLLILFYKDAYLFRTKMRAKTLFVVFAIPFMLVIHWELYLIFFVTG